MHDRKLHENKTHIGTNLTAYTTLELQLLRLIDQKNYFNDLMCPERIRRDMDKVFPHIKWDEIYPIMSQWHNDNKIVLCDGYWCLKESECE